MVSCIDKKGHSKLTIEINEFVQSFEENEEKYVSKKMFKFKNDCDLKKILHKFSFKKQDFISFCIKSIC